MSRRREELIDKAVEELDVREPGSSDETLTQRKLKQFEELENEFRALRKKHDELRATMKDSMRLGANVAPGRLGLKTGIRLVRRPSYKNEVMRLKGGGERAERYVEQLRNQTVPSAHFYVRLLHSKNGKQD